jgi:hypothetical protein
MAYKKDANQDLVDEQVSRLNSAGIINITTENLWRDAYNAMATNNLSLWNRKLDAIWLILGGDLKDNDPEDKEFNRIDLLVHQSGSLIHKRVGFEKLPEGESGRIAKQYVLLRKKSLFLRRLQNKQGKGTAYINEDDSDFD